MGFIELCGAVQTAQTQITIEPIVVSIGVCVSVWQCERIIKVKVVSQQDRLLLYILLQLKLSHVEDACRSV